ncbi:MAG: O-antigen ligase C-terminal domain-containing protein, partial [Rhodoferax sp.]|nr:O-antigen ligase C-terminal domain-containing protein [Rhodoferax sp.]
HLIVQKPWLGWGWGNLDYAHFITLYPGARFCDILDNAHNLPLHLAVELGLPVAFLVCGTGLWLVWRTQPWREADPTRQLAWSVLAVILLHSLLEYPLWYGPFQMAFGLSVWMLWRVEASSSKNTDAFRPVAPILFAQAAIFLIAFIAYAAWDYHRISQIYLAQNRRAAAYQDNTLEKIQGSWLFKNQVRFAELTTTSLTPANAAHVNSLAKDVLHFSPEGRVIEKLVESAVMLGRDDEALYYLARYRAAFPDSHARWAAKK